MKKTILALPLAALVAVGFVACSDAPTGLAPDAPNFELVDPDQQRASGNADVIATFSYVIPGNPGIRAGVAGVNPDGKEMGLCHTNGTGQWQNPSNKKWANAVPHPFCINEGGEDLLITLEPITSFYEAKEQRAGPNTFTIEKVVLSNDAAGLKVEWNSQGGNMTGTGEIHAWAIDQHGNQHGRFKFNLNQYNGLTNRFADYEATVEGAGVCVFGLSEDINATYYAPGDEDGVTVPGMLYWRTSEDCPEDPEE